MTTFFWLISTILVLSFVIWRWFKPWFMYHSLFIEPLEKLVKVTSEQHQVAQTDCDLALLKAAQFRRNFALEIKSHQSTKTAAYLKLEPLKVENGELQQKMKKVRDALQSWHRGSKSFWGNKSRKIKDDSILGWFGLEQTVAQKDSLERHRSAIYARIGEVKAEMETIYKAEIFPAKTEIDSLFAQKEKVAEDRKRGQSEIYWKDIANIHAVRAASMTKEIDALRLKLKSVEARYKHWEKSLP